MPAKEEAGEEQNPIPNEEVQHRDLARINGRRREHRQRDAKGDPVASASQHLQNYGQHSDYNNMNHELRDDISDIAYKMKPRKKGKKSRSREVAINEYEKSAIY